MRISDRRVARLEFLIAGLRDGLHFEISRRRRRGDHELRRGEFSLARKFHSPGCGIHRPSGGNRQANFSLGCRRVLILNGNVNSFLWFPARWNDCDIRRNVHGQRRHHFQQTALFAEHAVGTSELGGLLHRNRGAVIVDLRMSLQQRRIKRHVRRRPVGPDKPIALAWLFQPIRLSEVGVCRNSDAEYLIQFLTRLKRAGRSSEQ